MKTVTLPAHIEDGDVRLDAPLPPNVVDVEVRVRIESDRKKSVAAYVEALPPGRMSIEEIDRYLRDERESWPT